jgi:transcriptional regulator with XRE-family HTH domain
MSPQHTRRFSRLPQKYSNAIHSYRLALGLTQRRLARILGVTPGTVSSWERGLTCPVMPLLLKLAKELNTLAEHLYRDFFWPSEDDSKAQPNRR